MKRVVGEKEYNERGMYLPIKFICHNCGADDFQSPYYKFLCTPCAETIMFRNDEHDEDYTHNEGMS